LPAQVQTNYKFGRLQEDFAYQRGENQWLAASHIQPYKEAL